MEFSEIELKLLSIIDLFEKELPPNRFQCTRELAAAGEYGVALENLCSQLDDQGVAVTADVRRRLAALGGVLGIDPKHWERLTVKEDREF